MTTNPDISTYLKTARTENVSVEKGSIFWKKGRIVFLNIRV